MITASQLRAARVLLSLRQEDLAELAGMAVGTVNGAEAGSKATRPLTMKLLADVLSQAGIEFIPATEDMGPGVRLRDASMLEDDILDEE